MTFIYLFGNAQDLIIANKLRKTLSHYGGVLHIGHQSVTQCPEDAIIRDFKFLMLESDKAYDINQKEVIFIFKSKQNITDGIPKFKSPAISVVESHNEPALQTLSQMNSAALSCGMSGRDTLMISSISENSACISLQRKITTFEGEVIEPMDITVKFSGKTEDYVLLCICAVLLLSGELKEGVLELF